MATSVATTIIRASTVQPGSLTRPLLNGRTIIAQLGCATEPLWPASGHLSFWGVILQITRSPLAAYVCLVYY